MTNLPSEGLRYISLFSSGEASERVPLASVGV